MFSPEQPLSEGKLLQAESNLYDLGIFDWSSVGPRKDITDQTEEEAVVKVHEAKRNSITYAFGFEVSRRGGNVPTGRVAVPGLPTNGPNAAKVPPPEQTFPTPPASIEYNRPNKRALGRTAATSII